MVMVPWEESRGKWRKWRPWSLSQRRIGVEASVSELRPNGGEQEEEEGERRNSENEGWDFAEQRKGQVVRSIS